MKKLLTIVVVSLSLLSSSVFAFPVTKSELSEVCRLSDEEKLLVVEPTEKEMRKAIKQGSGSVSYNPNCSWYTGEDTPLLAGIIEGMSSIITLSYNILSRSASVHEGKEERFTSIEYEYKYGNNQYAGVGEVIGRVIVFAVLFVIIGVLLVESLLIALSDYKKEK